ncbi:MAG: glycosyltransferase family 39 protein [Phycisphaerae bacterium]|nr:glycosyltransferase family 39 protein [Phycisphaerae bacterium]
MDRGLLKSDVLRLGILAGLCLLIQVQQIHKPALVNPDGIFYIGLAQRLPGDYLSVARTYPPGYPFILWIAHGAASLCAGSDSARLWLDSSQRVTVLCQVLALIPLYFLGKLLVGAGRSFWALLILLVLPYPAQFASEILREWPHVLFLGLGFWLLCWGLHRRRWWVLALVGLDAGLGCLIRPECVQLVLYGFLGLASVADGKRVRRLTLCGAGILLAAGFLVPAATNVLATGILIPHQLRPLTISSASPVIHAIGPQAAGVDPLEFEVAENELLELPIHATDPAGYPLTFSLVGVPVGSRPVYQFWSMCLGSHFWTAEENEKRRLLSTYSRSVWGYEGIAFYAYARADARAGLHGVHRFWSPEQLRHLYTMEERERQAILQESPAGTWEYEDVAFYAFGEDSRPADTVPVYRLSGGERGDSWEVGNGKPGTGDRGQKAENKKIRTEEGKSSLPAFSPSDVPTSLPSPVLRSPSAGIRTGTAVWYVHLASEPPAGAGIQDGVFRWRPTSGQEGEYQLNIIADDGGLQSCQLVRIRVLTTQEKRGHSTFLSRPGAPSAGRVNEEKVECPLFQRAGLELLPEAVDRAFAAVAENLMVVFFVPWLLGLYWRLRYQAQRTERVLMVAIVAVNFALILWRHTVFGLGDDRRYSMGMIALTIFYVPVGIEVMARWLSYLPPLPRLEWLSFAQRQSAWFHGLVAVGIVVCLPKLVLPSPGNKAGYLAAAEWLRQNTEANDVVAVPDIRISFYGQRQGLLYGQYPNSRRGDYAVVIDDGGDIQVPAQWRREYSVLVDRRSKKTLTIYSTGRPKP